VLIAFLKVIKIFIRVSGFCKTVLKPWGKPERFLRFFIHQKHFYIFPYTIFFLRNILSVLFHDISQNNTVILFTCLDSETH